jgi:hypothetical protein
MTQQEHLKRIRARCVELLSIWDNKKDHNPLYNAVCGKEAEAGWKSTIAVIDSILPFISIGEINQAGGFTRWQIEAEAILAAWPIELLNP